MCFCRWLCELYLHILTLHVHVSVPGCLDIWARLCFCVCASFAHVNVYVSVYTCVVCMLSIHICVHG